MSDERFLSRWARLKRQGGQPAADAAAVAGTDDPVASQQGVGSAPAQAPASPADDSVARFSASPADDLPAPGPLPAGEAVALPDLASLTPESDFRPFMRAGVDAGQRNAALHKLFADPHYNQMDGLDIYIDDYSRPDPIPPAMLRMLNQARALGLFGAEDSAPGTAVDDARATAGEPDAGVSDAGVSDAGEPDAPDSPGAEGGGFAALPVPAGPADAEGPPVAGAAPIRSEHDGAPAPSPPPAR